MKENEREPPEQGSALAPDANEDAVNDPFRSLSVDTLDHETKTERRNTISTHSDSEPKWRPLLKLCDEVRYHLREHKELGPNGEGLLEFLGEAVKGECDGEPTVSFDIIREARLDKLLADITNKENHPEQITIQLRAQVTVAESLQRQWRTRFRESYLIIDHDRQVRLAQPGGRLESINFKSCGSNNICDWGAKNRTSLSESEQNARFEEGHWWLNLATACRDGMVTSSSEEFSQNGSETPTLPLLSGTEVVSRPSTEIRYIRHGKMSDMHTPLMIHVGFKIRILRGHRLKSPFAPKAGIRYDGLYILRQYGQRRLPETSIFRLRLVLDRVEGQRPMDELRFRPRPSELDEWQLYEKAEGDLVKHNYGTARYYEWAMARTHDKIEREKYEQTLPSELLAISRNATENDTDGEGGKTPGEAGSAQKLKSLLESDYLDGH